MATAPGDVRWLTAGTAAKPAGVPLNLDDARRSVLAGWLDADVAPTPAPVPVPPPVVPPSPFRPGRTRYGPATWGTASTGGGLKDADVAGTPPQAAADVHGVRVTAPKQSVALSNVWLRGWSNGLTVEHAPAVLSARMRGWVVEDCVFADNAGPTLFRGQGVYLAAADDVVFRRCCFVGNGRAKDKAVNLTGGPLVVSNGFSHGVYANGGMTQWGKPEGCRRVRFEQCVFAANAAWGALCKADGCAVVDCLFVGNAYGMLLNGSLPCTATGNVVIPGPRPAEWYAGQRGGAGGIQWRAAAGTLSDNLCVLPPECRMADRNWRAPAFELTLDANAAPNYHGPITCVGAGNVALGWDDDVVTRGVAVPGFRKGICPQSDWAGFAADAERQARNGTADAKALIARARRMAGAA